MSSALKAGSAKPDMFSSEWFMLHSRTVLLVITIVVGTSLGAYLYIRSNEIKRQRSEQALNEALDQLYSGNTGAGEAALAGVMNRYGGTHSGTVAAMRLAISKLNERKYGEALGIIDQALAKADRKFFASPLHELRASALADSGAFLEAGAAYEQAAAADQFESRKAALRYEASALYARGGNAEKAKEILAELSEGAASVVRGRARRLLGEIQATPAKAGGAG